MNQISPSFEELRRQVDDAVLGFLAARRDELAESQLLFEEIERVVRAGGKRIRPSFCYWGYRAAGLPHDATAVSGAAALELLHTFALIHDDVMDGTSERRGRPTVHVAHDVPTAILAGDLALVLADELLMAACTDAGAVTRTFEVYARMRREVIAGQYLDISSAREAIDESRARRIAVLKSGRYSVMEPLLVGAALANAAPQIRGSLARYGEPLGEAFQLKDDLLGIFGDPAATGKPVDSDIREGKRNLLFAKTTAALTGTELDFFTSRWGGNDLLDEEVVRLRGLVDASGARRAVETLVHELRLVAEDALDDDLDPTARAALQELVSVVVARDR